MRLVMYNLFIVLKFQITAWLLFAVCVLRVNPFNFKEKVYVRLVLKIYFQNIVHIFFPMPFRTLKIKNFLS